MKLKIASHMRIERRRKGSFTPAGTEVEVVLLASNIRSW